MNKRDTIKELTREVNSRVVMIEQLGGKLRLCKHAGCFCNEMKKFIPKNVVITKNGAKTRDGEPLEDNTITIQPEKVNIKIFSLTVTDLDGLNHEDGVEFQSVLYTKYFSSKQKAINYAGRVPQILAGIKITKEARMNLIQGDLVKFGKVGYQLQSIKLES